MYKMLWVPAVCTILAVALYFGFMQSKLPAHWIYASISCGIIGVIVVLTNKETTIEQPRYGLAIVFSLAAILLVLIPWVSIPA